MVSEGGHGPWERHKGGEAWVGRRGMLDHRHLLPTDPYLLLFLTPLGFG